MSGKARPSSPTSTSNMLKLSAPRAPARVERERVHLVAQGDGLKAASTCGGRLRRKPEAQAPPVRQHQSFAVKPHPEKGKKLPRRVPDAVPAHHGGGQAQFVFRRRRGFPEDVGRILEHRQHPALGANREAVRALARAVAERPRHVREGGVRRARQPQGGHVLRPSPSHQGPAYEKADEEKEGAPHGSKLARARALGAGNFLSSPLYFRSFRTFKGVSKYLFLRTLVRYNLYTLIKISCPTTEVDDA